MYCAGCGYALPDDANYCPRCGRPTRSFAPGPRAAPAGLAGSQREALVRAIGYQGGGGTYTVYWHPRCRFWAAVEPYHKGRHWCVYGTADPTAQVSLPIVCEINPLVDRVNRRCAGVFLRDGAGETYLAHTGKIGGGRPGIGKDAFTRFMRDATWRWVDWPDGKATQAIVVGRIDADDFLTQIVAFVGQVERFKEQVAPGIED